MELNNLLAGAARSVSFENAESGRTQESYCSYWQLAHAQRGATRYLTKLRDYIKKQLN